MEPIILRGDLPISIDGYCYGDGFADSSGSGSGNGSGYGYGYGYGDGYGYGEYWAATVANFSAKWPSEQQERLRAAQAAKAKIAFWRSHEDGGPANGGSGIELAAPGVIHTALGPLNLCHRGTLHATLTPQKWRGERWWIVAMWGEVIGDDEKFGCLKREIIGECL